MVTLKSALTILRSGQPFDIEVATLNGERKSYKGAQLCAGEAIGSPALLGGAGGASGDEKKPNHMIHGTVNIRLHNNDIRKIYPVLIEQINGKKMLL